MTKKELESLEGPARKKTHPTHFHWYINGICQICSKTTYDEDEILMRAPKEEKQMRSCLGYHCGGRKFLTTKDHRICQVCESHVVYK